MKYKALLVTLLLVLVGCNAKEQTKVVKNQFTTEGKSVTVYSTAKDTDLKLSESDSKISFQNSKQPVETETCVFVNPNKTFQTFFGIGGAITDASAEVFAKLTKEKQEELLKAYYDKEDGIGYTLARTSIHSCDFSSGSYTYVSDEDKELKTFDISHDKEFRIPLIKKAITAAGGKLPLYASPWSPPAFMKSNNHMLKGGKLLPDYYESWALYYTKFIKEYEKEGMPIWGITIQNEPMATQTWESCIYSAEEERDFLKNHLGPVMAKAGYSNKNIVVWDHNRDLISRRASVIFDDPEAAKYAWGTGFHWYESWSGGTEMYKNIGNVNESYPDKKLLFTEGCAESFRENGYQTWKNGERYGRSMINDFNYGTVGWTDWNILLDENGGPNHVGNFCFAPVHADTKTGDIIYTPSYYYIGHFSKFIRPNAKRVSTASSRSALLSTSFLNEDGKMVTVVMNETGEKISYKLYINLDAVELEIEPRAIQSIVY
ncbi:MAG: glycoside hydrolase family 30 protein [Melioribacteraceae bacterium]|nr:glycoside hydrolase family 30 protein [Melioribacteraceae bacterium]